MIRNIKLVKQFTCLSIHDSINFVNNLFHSIAMKKFFLENGKIISDLK